MLSQVYVLVTVHALRLVGGRGCVCVGGEGGGGEEQES